MATEIGQADVHRVFQRFHVRYEVHPYYVVWEQRPPGAPVVDQRIQAGFDVDLFGVLGKMELPRLLKEEGDKVVSYFEAVSREVQSKVGQGCTVEVVRYRDSIFLDTHLQPQAMVRIRISHCRGVDQSEGPAEEQALKAVLEKLHELDVGGS
jgi:hypothetical protein